MPRGGALVGPCRQLRTRRRRGSRPPPRPGARPRQQRARRRRPAAAETHGGDREGQVTSRSTDFNAWYTDVVAAAELADYGPVRGTMVIRHYEVDAIDPTLRRAGRLDSEVEVAVATFEERLLILKDKTIAYVADSLGRQMFQSMMCMVTGGKERPDVEDVAADSQSMALC